MDLGLKNKRALVAGASRGLGYATARALAREGASVCLCARNRDQAEASALTLQQETGARVLGFGADMAQSADVRAWVEFAARELGGVDLLLANAGGPPPGNFDKFTDADWSQAFELTLMSVVRQVRAALPYMRAAGGGAIVAVTSLSVREPIPGLLLSNVFRSGVVALLKSLSLELAADAIRVNNIAPGRIDTDRVRALDQFLAESAGISAADQKRRSEGTIPLGRYGEPDDFGRAAAFLLAPAAGYITGHTFVVDGGLLRQY